jgi:hypothetical protein
MKKELEYLASDGPNTNKLFHIKGFAKEIKSFRERFMSIFPQETEIEQEFNKLAKKIEDLQKEKEEEEK